MKANPDPGFASPDGASAGGNRPASFDPFAPNGGTAPGASRLRSRPRRRSARSPVSGPTFGEAVSSAWRHALETGDYVKALIGIRADRAALDVRRKATKVAIGLVAALGVGTIVIAASLRIVFGLSDGLAALFGGRGWLGDLCAGVLLLGGLAAGVAAYLSRSEKKELQEQMEKYERQHREHRAQHGRHVADATASNPRGTPGP